MNGKAQPLVSIVVPSFNQGRYIAETLRSCLMQDYRPIEIIVQDDASTDDTVAVVQSIAAPEIILRSKPDDGVVDAVNTGLASARGDILSIMSSDDVFVPNAVRSAVERLRADPECLLVYGDIEHIDESSNVTGRDVQGPFDLPSYLGRLMYVPQPGAFFTRAALQAAGGWRPEISYVADADFWIRIALTGRVGKLDQVVARYRYHAEQRDKHQSRILRDWEAMAAGLLHDPRLDAKARRYVRSGVHLARLRYRNAADWRERTKHLYAALWSNPALALDPRLPKRELLIGREPIWKILSRTKRAFGFRPRRA